MLHVIWHLYEYLSLLLVNFLHTSTVVMDRVTSTYLGTLEGNICFDGKINLKHVVRMFLFSIFNRVFLFQIVTKRFVNTRQRHGFEVARKKEQEQSHRMTED